MEKRISGFAAVRQALTAMLKPEPISTTLCPNCAALAQVRRNTPVLACIAQGTEEVSGRKIDCLSCGFNAALPEHSAHGIRKPDSVMLLTDRPEELLLVAND